MNFMTIKRNAFLCDFFFFSFVKAWLRFSLIKTVGALGLNG